MSPAGRRHPRQPRARLRKSTDALGGPARMAAGRARRSFAAYHQHQGATVSTILVGVDATERSEDAIVFGRRLADVAGADVVVACAYPYENVPTRAANSVYREALRDDARATAEKMRAHLEGAPSTIRIAANHSPAHALHDIAEAERAALIVVGSTHTGRAGRVLPGSTGERLLHGSPCSVAVVPKDYRTVGQGPIRRVGVAFIDSDEGHAAVDAAADLARALGAELEVIGVFDATAFSAPALMGGPSAVTLRQDIERHIQQSIDAMVAALPDGVSAHGVRLQGPPAETLAEYSAGLDLLVMGSRGYGPLLAVLAGGVSGRVLRCAQCPVIVIPRGVEAPLAELFGGAATTAA
jgi:nucleotide-binding universal stress UspA family protein